MKNRRLPKLSAFSELDLLGGVCRQRDSAVASPLGLGPFLSWMLVSLSLVIAGCSGDAEATAPSEEDVLVDNTTAVEVDLGEFSVTIPESGSNSSFVLDFSLYGMADGEFEGTIEEHLEDTEKRVRNKIVIAVRKLTREQLLDPTLAGVKTPIRDAVNEVLGDMPLTSVGFRSINLSQQ